MVIVDNLGDHLVGNVYVKYSDEEYSEEALKSINGKFKNNKKIHAIFSPVTDFQNAKCKQHMEGMCKRGEYCNYMHVKPISTNFKRELFEEMYIEHPEYRVKKVESSSDSFVRMRNERREKNRKNKKDKDKKRKRSR